MKKDRNIKGYRAKTIENTKISPPPIYIGETDRITYIYEIDSSGNCTKVNNVSYEIKIEEKWYLVSRYDSIHGFLHCHMTLSIKDKTEILLNRSRVIKKGGPKDWLTWAIKDFRLNFFEYRKGFLKRSKIKDLY